MLDAVLCPQSAPGTNKGLGIKICNEKKGTGAGFLA